MSRDLSEELGASVGALSAQLRLRFVDPAGFGQGFVALATLRNLSRTGARTVTSLAASDRVTTQAISARLKPLEDGGLVVRERDVKDARRTVVSPTALGTATIRAAETRVTDALGSAVSRLTHEQRQVLARAVPILAALAADLRGEEA